MHAADAADAGLRGLTPGVGSRLSLAVAASIAMHSALIFGLQPERGMRAGRPQSGGLVVHLESAGDLTGVSTAATPATSAPQAMPGAIPAPAPTAGALPQQAATPALEVRGLNAPPVPHYFRASELDQRPVPAGDIFPEFPGKAAVRSGRVRLRILIDERGMPDKVTVLKAEPPEVFDESALTAFGNARYSPGILNGQPVRSELLLEVDYEDPSNRQSRFASDRAGY